MSNKLNKLVTNIPVTLTEQEVINLSETLSAVRTAGGGGEGGHTYLGDGTYIGVDNNNNKISFLSDAANKLESITNKLDKSEFETASADFTTYTGTTAPNTYLTKTSADTLYQPTGDYVTTADVLTGTSNTLTGIKIGSTDYTIPTTDLSDYYTKTQVDSTFASASQLNSYLTTAQYQTDSASFALKTDTSSKNELNTEFAKYTKTEDLNIPTKVSDLTDSADYAKKTDLDGFVTSSDITTQDTDYVMTTTGWKVLTLPGGGMTQVIHDTTLTGQGNDNNSKLGVAWSALSGNVSSKLDTTAAAQTYQTIAGMSDYLTTTVASQTYLDKTTYATDSATFVTSSSNTITGTKQYALTTAGWTEVSTPTIPAITAESGISADGYKIGLTTTAINAITSVSSKVDKPTALTNKYLVLRTDSNGDVSGWCDFQDQSYSKSEALGTFVATANIDTITLSGDGKSVSTKLGVKTDVIATKDYVDSSFLPTSGGTVSGEFIVSGGSNFDSQFLKITRENVNGYGRIGLGQSGPLALKADDANQHTTQVNISPNTTNDQLVQVQHNGNTVGYLIPAVTSTTTAGLTNDGILHIILESE